MARRWREIVEQPRFAEERRSLEPNNRLLDDILGGVYRVLARKPQIGHRVGERIWAIATQVWRDSPPYVIYYRFDSRRVYLESIMKTASLSDLE